MRLSTALLGLIVMAAPAASTPGSPIEYRFTGVITNTSVLPTMSLPTSLSIGRSVSGFFRFDPTDAQIFGTPGPGNVLHDFPSRAVFAGLTAGNDSATSGTDPVSRRLFIDVSNRSSPGPNFDQYVFSFDTLVPSFPVSDLFSTQLSMALVDAGGTAFPGLGVPTGPLNTSSFPSRNGTLFFESVSRPGEGSAAVFSIDTLTFVPAPAGTLVLALIGALSSFRRVRQR